MIRFRNKRNVVALMDSIWQDREVLFDLDIKLLRPMNGEVTIERIENVEDVRGNAGDRGVLRVTNLRLIWHASAMPRINLSIGYQTINGITTSVVPSKIRGQTDGLYILAKGQTTMKFEFIFTCISLSNTKLFATVIGIHRAYETSTTYREMKMRCAFINDDENLKLLPSEYQCDKFEAVWNLTNDQSRHFVLGFRTEPAERLDAICRCIQSLHNSYMAAPILGVHYTSLTLKQSVPEIDEFSNAENEIEDDCKAQRIDAFAAYFTEGTINDDKEDGDNSDTIVYSEELGVAIQKLKPGFTVSDLWNINVD